MGARRASREGIPTRQRAALAIDVDEELSPIEALRELRIVSQPAREALDAQREVRNSTQHVDVELTVSVLREAVEQQIESTPRLVTSIVSWVDSWPEPAAKQ